VMHDIGTATREWQRDSLIEALEGATYEHRYWGKSWPGHPRTRYSETRPLVVKVVRTKMYGTKVWVFKTTNLAAAERGRTIIRQTANRWFKAGDRAVFAITMLDGTPAGTGVTIVDVQAGETYIHPDGRPQALKADGSPDLYRTPMVGEWWLDRA